MRATNQPHHLGVHFISTKLQIFSLDSKNESCCI